MTIPEHFVPGFLREHWFWPIAFMVLATDLMVGVFDAWSNPRVVETGVILDLAVIVPALYYWCYRSRGRPAVLRAIALSCLGIWVAGLIVPSEHQYLLSKVEFLSYIALVMIVLLEIRLVRQVYSLIWRNEPNARESVKQIADKEGMPLWVTRIMAWEASVWRRISNLFSRH